MAACVGREERFSGRTLYPSADAFPAQNSSSWDEGHHEKIKWSLLLRETWEEQFR